jgi:hypothetical protein
MLNHHLSSSLINILTLFLSRVNCRVRVRTQDLYYDITLNHHFFQKFKLTKKNKKEFLII